MRDYLEHHFLIRLYTAECVHVFVFEKRAGIFFNDLIIISLPRLETSYFYFLSGQFEIDF